MELIVTEVYPSLLYLVYSYIHLLLTNDKAKFGEDV